VLLNGSHILTQDRCIPRVRKINALLFKWSVDCFENQPAKVPCVYFIIYCYCGEVAIKSAGINSPRVGIAGLCVWTEGTSVQLGAFQGNTAEASTPGIVFYLLCFLNRNINQFSNAGAVLEALITGESKRSLFFFF